MDTATFTREDLIRKISALLATAESFAQEGNDEAANTYVSKAHALQQKYSIEEYMLSDKAHRPQKIVTKYINMPGAYGKRKVHLAHVVALRTDCTGYYNRTWGRDDNGSTNFDGPRLYQYVIFGFEDDVEWAETLILSLCHQADDSLKFAAANKPSWEHGKSFGASFHDGFSTEISRRLAQAKREAQANAVNDRAQAGGYTTIDEHNQATQTVALALVTKRKQVEDEMRAKVGRLGKGTRTESTSSYGYSAGRQAGSRATIARGSVGGSSPRGALH